MHYPLAVGGYSDAPYIPTPVPVNPQDWTVPIAGAALFPPLTVDQSSCSVRAIYLSWPNFLEGVKAFREQNKDCKDYCDVEFNLDGRKFQLNASLLLEVLAPFEVPA